MEKMKRRRGRGEEKKKGGEKGEERRGETSVFTGALYTFYVHGTLYYSENFDACCGKAFRFFSPLARKNRPGGSDFFSLFPAPTPRAFFARICPSVSFPPSIERQRASYRASATRLLGYFLRAPFSHKHKRHGGSRMPV